MAEHRAGRHTHHRDTPTALGVALAIRPEQDAVGGFMLRFEDGYQFYFAGDTGYRADFTETRERLVAPDFATIPIGAY